MNKIQNRVKLIGHLGADPEIRSLESGRKVANFRIATNSTLRTKRANAKKTPNGTPSLHGVSLLKSVKNT